MIRQRYGRIRKEQAREYRTKKGQTYKEPTEKSMPVCICPKICLF